MRRIYIDNIQPGSKLARTVFNFAGRPLLMAGVVMQQAYVEKLKANGIFEVYIDDDISEGIEVQDVIDEKTRQEAKSVLKRIMDSYVMKKTMNDEKVSAVINKIVDEILTNSDIVISLSDIRSIDDYTFEHSLNVCILAIMAGIGLGYNKPKLIELATGALLHDVGKLKIPLPILNKPGKLTNEEFEIIKKHTVYGYEMVRGNPAISAVSSYITLCHHERCNGSGYPLGLKAQNIHQAAKIVAVADVFDALTTNRVYRRKMKYHEAIEYIVSLIGTQFDEAVVHQFIQCVAVYPVGTGILLNTGEKGIVVRVNKSFPSRPVIRIIFDADGCRKEKFDEIDLMCKLNYLIEDTCDLDEDVFVLANEM